MGKSVSPRADMRRGILAQIRSAKKRLNWLIVQWDVRTTLYDLDGPRDDRGNFVIRPRNVSEYPENSIQDWKDLAAQSYAALSEMRAIYDCAMKMVFDLSQEQPEGIEPDLREIGKED